MCGCSDCYAIGGQHAYYSDRIALTGQLETEETES